MTLDLLRARLAFDCGMVVDFTNGWIDFPGKKWCLQRFTSGDTQSFCTAVVEATEEIGRNK